MILSIFLTVTLFLTVTGRCITRHEKCIENCVTDFDLCISGVISTENFEICKRVKETCFDECDSKIPCAGKRRIIRSVYDAHVGIAACVKSCTLPIGGCYRKSLFPIQIESCIRNIRKQCATRCIRRKLTSGIHMRRLV